MMKFPLLSLTLIYLALSFFPQALFSQIPNDLNIEGLFGKVKNLNEQISEIKNTNGIVKESSKSPSRRLIFNKDGKITYEWRQIADLTPFEHFYTYDKNKRFRRTLRDNTGFNSSKPFETFSLSFFTFNPNENALFEEVYMGNEIDLTKKTQKYEYIFDKSGKLVRKIMFSVQDVPLVVSIYQYDSQNLPFEVQLSMAGKSQILKYSYEIDAQGNWTKRTAQITLADQNNTIQTEITYRKVEYYK